MYVYAYGRYVCIYMIKIDMGIDVDYIYLIFKLKFISLLRYRICEKLNLHSY